MLRPAPPAILHAHFFTPRTVQRRSSRRFAVSSTVCSTMSNRTITVVDYDDAWPTAFERESQRLRWTLGEVVVRIHHIGSTAVPGLAAKPVIDVLVEVTSLLDLDAKEQVMVALGYRPKGENGIAGRRYFQLGGAARTHHVHAFVAGDEHVRRHLAFRDYLRRHPSVAAEYGDIKRAAAAACVNDSEVYSAKKNGFVKLHERLALDDSL